MVLAIIEHGYRGSVETQFADVLYLARELNRQFGRLDIALRGLAITYALVGTFDPCIALGSQRLDTLPNCQRSIRLLLDEGVTLYADAQDLHALGLTHDRLIAGVQCEEANCLARRWRDYDRVWFL